VRRRDRGDDRRVGGHDNEVALTFGLLTAAAVACLMVATAVGAGGAGGGGEGPFDEEQARRVEDLVGNLVAGGAEEARVRQLVAEAVRLGRGAQPRAPREEEEEKEKEGRG
jgi:hypothetical protein